MFVIFLALAFTLEQYEVPDQNGWGRKIRKAVKKVGHAVKKVTKPITKPVVKAVHKVGHTVSKAIYDRKDSMWAEPIKITKLEKQLGNKQYSTTNLDTLVNQIASEFKIDAAKLRNFFHRARFTRTTKSLFNILNFDKLGTVKDRVASLGTCVVKVTKDGNTYNVDVREAVSQATIYANNAMKTVRKRWGGLSRSSHTSRSWRPLTANEITQIFNEVNNNIRNEVNQNKKI